MKKIFSIVLAMLLVVGCTGLKQDSNQKYPKSISDQRSDEMGKIMGGDIYLYKGKNP